MTKKRKSVLLIAIGMVIEIVMILGFYLFLMTRLMEHPFERSPFLLISMLVFRVIFAAIILEAIVLAVNLAISKVCREFFGGFVPRLLFGSIAVSLPHIILYGTHGVGLQEIGLTDIAESFFSNRGIQAVLSCLPILIFTSLAFSMRFKDASIDSNDSIQAVENGA